MDCINSFKNAYVLECVDVEYLELIHPGYVQLKALYCPNVTGVSLTPQEAVHTTSILEGRISIVSMISTTRSEIQLGVVRLSRLLIILCAPTPGTLACQVLQDSKAISMAWPPALTSPATVLAELLQTGPCGLDFTSMFNHMFSASLRS